MFLNVISDVSDYNHFTYTVTYPEGRGHKAFNRTGVIAVISEPVQVKIDSKKSI